MPQSPIATEIHHALDVHLNVASQIPFKHIVAIQMLAQRHDFDVIEFVDPSGPVNPHGIANSAGR